MIKWDDNTKLADMTATNPNVAQLFLPLVHTLHVTQLPYNFSPRTLGLSPEQFPASSNYLLHNDPSRFCFPGRLIFAHAAIRFGDIEWMELMRR